MSLDAVCRRFEDSNRAVVWFIRFRALTAWCERMDVAQWLRSEPSHTDHARELAASFDLNDAWEFDAERFRSAVRIDRSLGAVFRRVVGGCQHFSFRDFMLRRHRSTFDDRATRGVHPRVNCAARRPDNTANSNAFMPSGRLIIMASSSHQRIRTHQQERR